MPDPTMRVLTVTPQDRKLFHRLDHFLTFRLRNVGRGVLKRLHQNHLIFHAPTSPYRGPLPLKKMPPAGSEIAVQIPPPLSRELVPENVPLEKIYEDQHLLVVNKRAGMVAHPAPGHSRGTLANAVLYHCPDLEKMGGVRPGLPHRLDKGTTGVMVVAKHRSSLEALVSLFASHKIERTYRALVLGHPLREEGTVRSTITRDPHNRLKMTSREKLGKTAITHYKAKGDRSPCTLMELSLETGRTHQVRVHLSQQLQLPVLMDPLYGHPSRHLRRLPQAAVDLLKDGEHPLLHAFTLGFRHPFLKKDLFFQVPPPPLFQKTWAALEVDPIGKRPRKC